MAASGLILINYKAKTQGGRGDLINCTITTEFSIHGIITMTTEWAAIAMRSEFVCTWMERVYFHFTLRLLKSLQPLVYSHAYVCTVQPLCKGQVGDMEPLCKGQVGDMEPLCKGQVGDMEPLCRGQVGDMEPLCK